jgi:demethylmenaquinone methyltransferase/2-methoxy-6-polyprenyl-1,4-benzoquinol methylase
MPEAESVQRMFAGIAGKYDTANHVLSGYIDYYWRNKLLEKVKKNNPAVVVDLATGSGDVAICLKKGLNSQTVVKGYDFCEPMLEEARKKAQRLPETSNMEFSFGDCLNLPIEDNSANAVTISFGFRNLEDRKKGLDEFYRILKPGGSLYILEFTQPYPIFSTLYYFYLKFILPKLAKFVTGNSDAYDYLAESIQQFPNRFDLEQELVDSHFTKVQSTPYTLSIVAIHQGTK